jgi:filamentous hemagglutinin family protein
MSRLIERTSSLPATRRNAARAALLLATTALTSPALLQPALAQNVPTGGSVAAGSATISQPSATQLTITQSSQSAVVNWQGFSIGQGSAVNIAQPNASSAILNRVTGNTPSTIAGALTANGQVYLVNPNGIAITTTGTVNTGGFVASTLGISDADFMSGKRTFTGSGASAAVSNAGTITIGRGGYAALIGGTVSNSGAISVPLGKVGLSSGEQATLDFSGDGFLQVAMPTSAGGKGALIKNSGSIAADGGSVIISAATAREAARNAINISGLVQARSIGGRSGAITIGGGDGGKVRISGRLDASSRDGAGGKIAVTGQTIKLKAASVDASGATVGGNINIGGGRQGFGPLMHADTVSIDAASTIKADAVTTGNGGNVVVWSDLLTTFAGTISAKGGAASGNGGEAEVSGKATLDYTGFTDLSAARGGFGTLLLDPYNVTISSAANANQSGFTATGNDSVISVTTLQNALAGANVTVSTGGAGSAGTQAGDITVANAVTWSSGTTLTLSAYRNIAVNANLTGGAGAGVVLRADNAGTGTGSVTFGAGTTVTASGGVSVYYNPASNPAGSGINVTSYTSPASFAAFQGAGTTITGYMLVNTVNDLQNVQNTLGGSYALGRDINASATATWNGGAGFAPIGNSYLTPFTGVLDGQGHVVSGLTINRPTTDYVGLIGYMSGSGARVTTIGLAGGSARGQGYVGGLVGWNDYGTVRQSYATGAVTGSSNSVGGLVGVNYGGTLLQSYATGAVTAGVHYVGGLVGFNYGTVDQSYATGAVTAGGHYVGGLVGVNGGTVQQSYATGAVTGYYYVGGLVGANEGTVQQSYATGAVTGYYYVGGLVGVNSVTVQQSYATGAVTGSSYVGGLVGWNYGQVTTSYWDTVTSGTNVGIGGGTTTGATGLTTANARTQSSYSGWDFTGTWYMIDGQTRPFLRSEYSTTITNAHQLQLMAINLGASYTLANNIDASETSGANAAGMWATAGFVPIGSYSAKFTGVLDGQSHVVSGLTINRPTTDNVGLIGYMSGSGALVTNIGLAGGSVSGNNSVGALVGANSAGTVKRSYATGAVTGSNAVGGLVGYNYGTVGQSYATGAVTGGADYVGGLVGFNYGTVDQSYATGAVTGSNAVGGLVGYNYGTVQQSYATGAVTGGAGGYYVGGLVGFNYGTVDQSYATGAVTGGTNATYVGGLVGYNYGTVTASYWDTVTSGQSVGIGGGTTTGATGLTTAQMTDGANYRTTFAGFEFDTVWALAGNGFRPQLYGVSGVVGVGATMSYGDAAPLPTYLGLGYWNTLTSATTLTTTANATSNVGTYAMTGSAAAIFTGGGASRIVYADTITVRPRALTVTADALSRAYGDANGLSYTTTSLGGGAALSGSLATTATVTSDVGSYAIGQGSVTSANNPNYAITYVGANLAVIRRALTVTANAQSRTYGDASPALSYTVGGNGLVNGDSLSGLLATGASAASNVGTYGITQGSLAASSNYALTYQGANLTLTQRALTVTANAQSRTYGDANPALTYTIGGSGLVNGDPLSGALVTTATTTSNIGSYDITLGTLAATPNYNLTYVGALLTVRPTPGTDTALLASSTVRDHFDALALPADAQPLFDATPGTTATGTGVFYADPRFDRIFVCFGSACFVVKS